MPERILRFRPAVAGLCLCVMAMGCGEGGKRLSLSLKKSSEKPQVPVPPHIKGTVAEYAAIVGGAVPVQAHGIVVGLGESGSADVPAQLRKSLTEYLIKAKLGSYRMGTAAMTPELVLQDKDTSVVRIDGVVPPGAPIGSRFDVVVTSSPQTCSLDGGILMPRELSLAFGGISVATKVWAEARGPVFVNPFIDPTEPAGAAKWKTGRIIGGGKVTRAQQIRLVLRRGDYATADLIQRRINERFSAQTRIANAKNRSVVTLRVPSEFHEDYEHFLKLVMHLPIRFGPGGQEAYARRIAKQMNVPAADHNGLALVWEAMGRQVIPIVQRLYTSTNPLAAFHAARTGMRLGDRQAVEVIVHFAASTSSPLQIPAIRELGRHESFTRAVPTLRHLVDDSNERVRVAAYEALRKHGDRSVVRQIDVAGQFALDLVNTRGEYTIYVTRTGEPRIVLFGRNMTVCRPVYFESPDELVTINAFGDSDKLTVFRRIQRTGTISDPFKVDRSVHSLIETLASLPLPGDDKEIMGLGLTYSQVVGVLYRMCKHGDIPAKFVLQQAPDLERIYKGAATVGRPD